MRDFQFWLLVFLFIGLPVLQWIGRKLMAIAQDSAANARRPRPTVQREPDSADDFDDEIDEGAWADVADSESREAPAPYRPTPLPPGTVPIPYVDLRNVLKQAVTQTAEATRPAVIRPADVRPTPRPLLRPAAPPPEARAARRYLARHPSLVGIRSSEDLRRYVAWVEILGPPRSLSPDPITKRSHG